MGKYLIQDIIPPQKKHPATEKKATPVHSHAEVHHAKTLPHDKETVRAPKEHKAHGDHAATHTEIGTKDSQVTQHPRTMIAEQLDDDARAEGEMTHKPPLALTDEIIGEGEAVGAWPYNNDNIPESSFRNNLPPHIPHEDEGMVSKGGNWLPWILGPIALVAVLVLIFNFFSGATITLIAKTSAVPIEQKFTVLHRDEAGTELSYSVIKEELSDTLEVPATGTKTVTTKALGKIIIYNEQVAPQRLIKNTRFESTAGKIYRINESITVPKSVTKAGKTTLGSIEVTIYADEAGTEYNSSPTDFTIPGLKNTPQAKMVYARSKGIIAGGASGTTKSVSVQDLKKAGDDLRVALETKLRNKAHADLSGFAGRLISYDQGILVDLKDSVLSNEKATSDDKAVVAETGTLYMGVFDRTLLTKVIAKAVVPTYGGEEVVLSNLENLTFGIEDVTIDALVNKMPINFSLKGTPELKWVIDQDAITKDLLGLPKADFNSKMAAYPTVERAKASLRPFWKQSFPVDPKAISIKIVDQISN